MPCMPSAPTPPGFTRSAPAQNTLPDDVSTLARTLVSASMSPSASASARIDSTETWLFGGRENVSSATWPRVSTETSPYWDFMPVFVLPESHGGPAPAPSARFAACHLPRRLRGGGGARWASFAPAPRSGGGGPPAAGGWWRGRKAASTPRPQEIAGHHPFVHLGGAIVDAHGAQLGAHLLQRQLLGHAHGAEGLHRTVDHLVGHLGGEPLDHRDLQADVAALVELPGAVVDHQPRRVDLGGGLGH